jgi:hypothetical protein
MRICADVSDTFKYLLNQEFGLCKRIHPAWEIGLWQSGTMPDESNNP